MDFLFVWLVEQFSVWWSLQSMYTIYGTSPRRSSRLKMTFWQDFILKTFLFEKTRFYLTAKPRNSLISFQRTAPLCFFTKLYRTKHVLPLLCALLFNLSSKKANHLTFYKLYPWFLVNIFSPRNVHGFCQAHLAFHQSRDSHGWKLRKRDNQRQLRIEGHSTTTTT